MSEHRNHAAGLRGYRNSSRSSRSYNTPGLPKKSMQAYRAFIRQGYPPDRAYAAALRIAEVRS